MTDAELEALAAEVRDAPDGPPETLQQTVLRRLGLAADQDGPAMAPSALPAGAFASDRSVDAREWIALHRGLTGACDATARMALCEALTRTPPDADLRLPASGIPPLEMDEVTHRTAEGGLIAMIARGRIAATGAPCVVFRHLPEGALQVMTDETFDASGVMPLRAEGDLPQLAPPSERPMAGGGTPPRLAPGALARAARVTAAEWLRLRMALTGEAREQAEIALCLLLLRRAPDARLCLPALSAVPPDLDGLTHQHQDGSFHRRIARATMLPEGGDCVLLRTLPEGALHVWPAAEFVDDFVPLGDPADLSAPLA